jgi:hypothetical protein
MLELLYHISHEIAATLDLPQILQRVLSLAVDNIGATSGSIIVMNNQGEPIESALVYKGEILDHSTKQLGQLIQKGLAGWVIQHQKAALVPDTSQDIAHHNPLLYRRASQPCSIDCKSGRYCCAERAPLCGKPASSASHERTGRKRQRHYGLAKIGRCAAANSRANQSGA